MLGEIQAMNALAADMISNGDHQNAFELLSQTVVKLSWCLLAPNPIPDRRPGEQKPSVPRPHSPPIHGMSVYVEDAGARKEPSAHDGDFYFHPFILESGLFAEDDEASFSITEEQHCIAVITCLFNLGLCCHIKWSRQKNCSCLLSKALYYYDEAYSMTKNLWLCPTDPIMQAIMAVCNNATHCLSELSDLQQLKLWNDRLCHALCFISTREKKRESFLFFQLNAFHNSLGRISAAAA